MPIVGAGGFVKVGAVLVAATELVSLAPACVRAPSRAGVLVGTLARDVAVVLGAGGEL